MTNKILIGTDFNWQLNFETYRKSKKLLKYSNHRSMSLYVTHSTSMKVIIYRSRCSWVIRGLVDKY